MSSDRVLVTDGETRAVVAAARGLAEAGFEVAVAAATPPRWAATHWSRSVAQRITTPNPLTDEAGFLQALHDTLAGGDFGVLMPGGDASLLDISRGRDRLEPHVGIGLPAHDCVQRALDKAELAMIAERHRLVPPATAVCDDLTQALEAAGELGFPVVVKPVSSVIDGSPVRRREGSLMAAGAEELARVVADFGGACLVQQRVEGHVISFAGVFADGRLLAEAVSRYHRTWYPDAGSACYSETIWAPDLLRGHVVALLDELGWSGLFELELIERADGGWHAIDLNPRPYGSLALAIGAGANLPAVWCRHLLGSAPPPVRAVPGIFYRWADADLRHGICQLHHGRGAAAAAVLRIRPGVVHPYARRSDPGPAAARLLELGTLAIDPGRRRPPVRADDPPIVIVGAGPNGLAAVAHLRHAGLSAVCFGRPLEAWSDHMPAGMLLRSRRRSSHIADPRRALTIDAYERAEDRVVGRLGLSLEEFIDYGRWFQRQAVPDADRREVTQVARRNGAFHVRLQDGEELEASRVVVAAGLGSFINCPVPFDALPSSVCSHAYEHSDLRGFRGRRVAVIGSGQSALESAALLHEAGAAVEVLVRGESIYWLAGDPATDSAQPAWRRWILPISPPPTDVGGRVTGWIAAAPDVFRRIPRRLQPELAFRCIRPAGAGWLRPRLADVTISYGRQVIAAEEVDGEVTLDVDDGSQRIVDHVLLGTGYKIDVRRYPFLAPELAAELQLADGYPVLGPGLESSVAGLHFMGAPAAYSFGPIMRFVVGTWYAAPALTRRAAGRRQPPISFSF